MTEREAWQFKDSLVIRDTIITVEHRDCDLARRVSRPFDGMKRQLRRGRALTSKQARWVNDVRRQLGLESYRFG